MRFGEATGDGSAVVGFKGTQGYREQLASRHDDNIEAWRDVISTEDLSNQTLSTISNHRAAKPFRRRNTQTTDCEPIRFRKQRVVAARNAAAMLVDVLEIGMSADPLAWAELQTAIRR